jgi:hypothetical protein
MTGPSFRTREATPRRAWAGLCALVAASALVFWVFDALPFQDLPAHAGLIALRHRLTDSPFEQRFFVLAPQLGPYSLFRFLGDALLGWLGPVGAVRALATLPVIATPLAVTWARRVLHGDRSPAAGYFAVALGFGFMTALGFASYLLGVAALVAALTMWLKVLVAADRGAPARAWEASVAVAGPALLLVHGDAFVVFLGLAVTSALATGRRGPRIVRLRALVPGALFAASVAWSERASALPTGSVPVPHAAFLPHFQGPLDKLSLLVTPTLLTRTGVDAAVAIFLWIAIGGAAIATARSLKGVSTTDANGDDTRTHARALLASAAVTAVAFVALPHSIGWFGFVDGRLVPVVLVLALLAVRRDALTSRWLRLAFARGGAAAAAVMVTLAFLASYAFQSEAAGWREVLQHVPANARLLNLPIDPNSRWFTAHPFVHYDKLALAERPILVSDVWFHQGTALYPTARNPSLRLPDTYSESDLRTLDWASYRLRDWDFALVRTGPSAPEPAVPASLATTLSLLDHHGGWWLFRIARE